MEPHALMMTNSSMLSFEDDCIIVKTFFGFVTTYKRITITVHPRLSEPHLSESSFIRTHKYGCESH